MTILLTIKPSTMINSQLISQHIDRETTREAFYLRTNERVIRDRERFTGNNYKIKSHNIKIHTIPDWISNVTAAAAIVLIFGPRLSAASIIPPARPFYCNKKKKQEKMKKELKK